MARFGEWEYPITSQARRARLQRASSLGVKCTSMKDEKGIFLLKKISLPFAITTILFLAIAEYGREWLYELGGLNFEVGYLSVVYILVVIIIFKVASRKYEKYQNKNT